MSARLPRVRRGAVRRCPSSSRRRTSRAGRARGRRAARRRTTSTTSSCWAWAGRGSRATSSQAVGTATLPVPVTVLKQYRTPAFVGPRTLAFAVSYSGDTEETLAMARGAHAAGATVVADLERWRARQRSRASTAPLHVPCPADIAVPAARARRARSRRCSSCCSAWACCRRPTPRCSRAQQQLARRRDQCRPDVDGERNPARELARRIGRTIPLIYGMGGLGGRRRACGGSSR